MRICEIPDRISIKSPPYTGVYQGSRGSFRKGVFLRSWWNDEDRGDENDVFPHISVSGMSDSDMFTYFHISYPILFKGDWDVVERKENYHVYYKVDKTGAIFEKDNKADFGRSGGPSKLGEEEFNLKFDEFARAFVLAIVHGDPRSGTAVDPYRPKKPDVPLSAFAPRVPPNTVGLPKRLEVPVDED